MAMIITLRDRIGNDEFQMDLEPTQTPPRSYPEIVVYGGKNYVIKQVGRDKKSALYQEAVTFEISGEE